MGPHSLDLNNYWRDRWFHNPTAVTLDYVRKHGGLLETAGTSSLAASEAGDVSVRLFE